jgi:5'-phosphate synthase pdxT subunit
VNTSTKPSLGTPAVGILSYQGCIAPHEELLAAIGVSVVRVRTEEDLQRVDRLIMPGGESTTMLRFIQRYNMAQPLQKFAQSHPVWGICAGSILAAREVCNPNQFSLNLIDIKAYRNFYGPQTASFTATLNVSEPSPSNRTHALEAHFIRAPKLEPLPASTGRPPVQVVARHGDDGVFFMQGRIWASSFHVELGRDPKLHQIFCGI